jgi:hypothetical protein
MLDRIPLTELPHELTTLTGQKSPRYRRLYELVLDGVLPAERINGRLFVRPANVPAIAETLGMTVAA